MAWMNPMQPLYRQLALMCMLGLSLGACRTTGTGFGTLQDGATTSVAFDWRGSDAVSGSMTATFADGRTFTGKYFQITSETRLEYVEPLWTSWSPRWHGWRYWDPMPTPQFVTHYSGRVLANLSTADGEHMRCRFRLIRPSVGMAGGGAGDCQLPNGETIESVFPAA